MTDTLKEEMLEKRRKFHELIHAAFILETDVTFYLSRPQPTEDEMSWLLWVYPNSRIKKGNDQGASYMNIKPIP